MGIKVLSLFDGISCGMVALERAGIKVDEYIAYEIDEDAIKVRRSEVCGNGWTVDVIVHIIKGLPNIEKEYES